MSTTDQHLSLYERQRLANILKNQQVLQKLGLAAISSSSSSSAPNLKEGGRSRKRRQQQSSSRSGRTRKRGKTRKGPAASTTSNSPLPHNLRRRSARIKATSSSHTKKEKHTTTTRGATADDDGEDSDYSEELSTAGDSGDDDSDYDDIERPRPWKQRQRQRNKVGVMARHSPPASPSPSSSSPPSSFLKCEGAKTGRSSCRKCREKIEKGDVRIGMAAWISGRNAVTWQHPGCFFSLVSFSREATGRSKCKVSGERFKKGEAKVTFQSHTAASSAKLHCLSAAVRPIAGILGAASLKPSTWTAFDDLADAEKKIVQAQMTELLAAGGPTNDGVGRKQGGSDKGSEANGSSSSGSAATLLAPDQPPSNKIAKASGRVSWKWGSHLCFGKLIPSKETTTHCYARTHKGNIKTLAKGKAYWKMMHDG